LKHAGTSSVLITIDVEDWFQVENFKPWIAFSDWSSLELRVETNIHRLLDLFESTGNVRATFFILGWIANRLPHLLREILARGHELASHGDNHQLSSRLSAGELKRDLSDSKKRIEDIGGTAVEGFRAPSFSISAAALEWIARIGYRYDSSYNSFSLHGRYGKIGLEGCARVGAAYRLGENFFEIPLSNMPLPALGRLARPGRLNHACLPWGGGAYFRFLPLKVFLWGVRRILNRDGAYIFYMHPWEVDPGQPRVSAASLGRRLRHYTQLRATISRLEKMIRHFRHCRFVTCREYLTAHSHA
jgi:polysaccharide deacetylase family protein (PEP-CTERM system associated)